MADEPQEPQVQDPPAPQEPGPDLDALASPEGGHVPEIHSNPVPGSPDPTIDEPPAGQGDLPQDLPNLDPPADPAPPADPPVDPPADPQPPADPPTDPSPGDTPFYQQTLQNVLDKVNESLPEDKKLGLPEDLSEENYLQYLNALTQRELDPRVQQMQDALDQGIEWDALQKSIQSTDALLGMEPKDGLKEHYKEAYGWDDEKAQEVVDKLETAGTVDVEWEKAKHTIKQSQDARAQQLASEQDQIRQEQIKQNETLRKQQVADSLNVIKNMDNVYGLPISEAERAEFAPVFESMVTPTQEGNAPLLEQLQSNETLAKVAFILWKGDAKFREAMTDAKEGAKNDFLNRLEPEPQKPPSSSQGPKVDEVDMDKLSEPERIR